MSVLLGSAELCLDRIEIFLDDNVHVFLVGEDMLIFPDLPQGLFIRFLECKDLEADQLIEAHLEDRCRLALGKVKILCILLKARHTESDLFGISRHQAFLRVLHVL